MRLFFRILVFNCTSGRNAEAFLTSILEEISAHLRTINSGLQLSTFFDQVIFCSNVTYQDGGFKGGMLNDFTVIYFFYYIPDLSSRVIIESKDDADPLKVQHELGRVWSSLISTFPTEAIFILPSIQHAHQTILRKSEERLPGQQVDVDVLITGSLHLVGGFIEVAGLSEVAL